jgi:hypothetical protein
MISDVKTISAANEPAEQPRVPQPLYGFAVLVIRWFRSQLGQPPEAAAVLPDDARNQLQHDRLFARRRIERLSMTIRPPF